MYDNLIKRGLEALESGNHEEIISTIREIMLTVPEQMTDEALSVWLSR